VTETTEATPAKRRSGGLSGMLLSELKQVAAGLGIKGAGGMRKSQLIEAIKAAQSGGHQSGQAADQAGTRQGAPTSRRTQNRSAADGETDDRGAGQAGTDQSAATLSTPQTEAQQPVESRSDNRSQRDNRDRSKGDQGQGDRGESRDDRRDTRGDNRREDRGDDRVDDRGDGRSQDNRGDNRGDNRNRSDNRADTRSDNRRDERRDDDQGSSRRNRRRRGRDRDRDRSGSYRDRAPRRDDAEPQINEDDVLVPVAGILDVLDNYAFVRTSGYLPGADDVYVSLSMVRKYGLRRGDAITGQVRQPREGERKEKFNPLVRIETVNGADLSTARNRVEFSKLTPLYASERLRLETESNNMIGRVIDIAAPIGKGQRGLIVSPPKAGKTMIMQSIANSITLNNPECHLMIVLVDERPEEVTDFQRTVKGEVIASTFDRPATDHTTVAELAIERAKRLVELGHDVVVLLDGITRLGRAYNLAAPASGRILSGGVDSSALYPPKRFFGAARNIEDGGSLTILATALIETGSKMDEVIFEEFKGTGNMELRLRREFADKRIFPAIDAVQSGTRREELLMSKEELSIVWKLRRVLSALDGQQALELLLERLKKTHSNVEFLMQVQKTTPMAGNGRDDD
jgi:transcription termination factor Rho